MIRLNYLINNKKITINASDESIFSGEEKVLSKIGEDITSSTEWYQKGFAIFSLEKVFPFNKILSEITLSVKKIIEENLTYRDLSNFTLSNYHKFIKNEEHLSIDKKLKRLYPKDLGFEDQKIVEFIGNLIKKKLSYKKKNSNFNHWIILRLSLPKSTGLKGFNPSHKDIYEDYDLHGEIPKMVNTWIPICGVNDKTGLPIVEGSHLYPESKIIRTKCGAKREISIQ